MPFTSFLRLWRVRSHVFSSWYCKTLHNTDACSVFKTVTETWLTEVKSSRSLMYIFSFIFIDAYQTVSPCDCYIFTQSAKPKWLQCRLFCTTFQGMPSTWLGGMSFRVSQHALLQRCILKLSIHSIELKNSL